MTVKDIYDFIDGIAPFSTQSAWDNSGLLVGNACAEVTGIVTCLDVTEYEIELAKKSGCNLIVSHHPVIFHPAKNVLAGDPVFMAVSSGIGIISAHTNLDKAVGGVNDTLCDNLGMKYEKCGAEIAEGFLNIGTIEGVDTPAQLATHISEKLGTAVRYSAASDRVNKIGVCSGSAAEMYEDALSVGCDAYITGDASYHQFLDAAHAGISMFAAGHFQTENAIAAVLAGKIGSAFSELEIIVSDRRCPEITVL